MEFSSGYLVLAVITISFALGLILMRVKYVRERNIIYRQCPPALVLLVQETVYSEEDWEEKQPLFERMYGADAAMNAYFAVKLKYVVFVDVKTSRLFFVRYKNEKLKSWYTEEYPGKELDYVI